MTGVGAPAGKYDPMLTVVPGEGSGHEGGKGGSSSLIDEIVREGARRMLAGALQAEVDAYSAAHAGSVMGMATGWWCATAATGRGRS
jgi:hypothetical protein